MNCWPHGVIVVPTTPTTASMYTPSKVPLGTSRLWNAWPQSGWARIAESRYAPDTSTPMKTKPYWTRLNDAGAD